MTDPTITEGDWEENSKRVLSTGALRTSTSRTVDSLFHRDTPFARLTSPVNHMTGLRGSSHFLNKDIDDRHNGRLSVVYSREKTFTDPTSQVRMGSSAGEGSVKYGIMTTCTSVFRGRGE